MTSADAFLNEISQAALRLIDMPAVEQAQELARLSRLDEPDGFIAMAKRARVEATADVVRAEGGIKPAAKLLGVDDSNIGRMLKLAGIRDLPQASR